VTPLRNGRSRIAHRADLPVGSSFPFPVAVSARPEGTGVRRLPSADVHRWLRHAQPMAVTGVRSLRRGRGSCRGIDSVRVIGFPGPRPRREPALFCKRRNEDGNTGTEKGITGRETTEVIQGHDARASRQARWSLCLTRNSEELEEDPGRWSDREPRNSCGSISRGTPLRASSIRSIDYCSGPSHSRHEKGFISFRIGLTNSIIGKYPNFCERKHRFRCRQGWRVVPRGDGEGIRPGPAGSRFPARQSDHSRACAVPRGIRRPVGSASRAPA